MAETDPADYVKKGFNPLFTCGDKYIKDDMDEFLRAGNIDLQ